MTVRWQFEDMLTSEVYTVELNPKEADTFRFAKSFEFSLEGGDRVRSMRQPRQPISWNFGGVVRSETHHDALISWQKRPGKVRVTDHLGRTFEVMMQGLDLQDRRPAGNDTWRFRYTFSCLILRRIA